MQRKFLNKTFIVLIALISGLILYLWPSEAYSSSPDFYSTISVSDIDFGDQYVGFVTSKHTTVYNNSSEHISISITRVSGSEDFSCVSPEPPTVTDIPAGGSYLVHMRFNSSSIGLKQAIFNVNINPNLGDDAQIPFTVTGNGKSLISPSEPEPELNIYPTTIDFGIIELEDNSVEYFNIENTGGGRLDWSTAWYSDNGRPSWINISPPIGHTRINTEIIEVKFRNVNLNRGYNYEDYIKVISNGGTKLVKVKVKIKPDSPTEYTATPQAYYKCYDYDVYWYDSENNREEKKQECGKSGYTGNNYCFQRDVYRDFTTYGCSEDQCLEPSTEKIPIKSCNNLGCSNGQCNEIAPEPDTPTSHDSYTCYDNDIYWYDSEGSREEKKEECGVSGYSGKKYCYNGDVHQDYIPGGCSNNECDDDPGRRLIQNCENNDCINGVCKIGKTLGSLTNEENYQIPNSPYYLSEADWQQWADSAVEVASSCYENNICKNDKNDKGKYLNGGCISFVADSFRLGEKEGNIGGAGWTSPMHGKKKLEEKSRFYNNCDISGNFGPPKGGLVYFTAKGIWSDDGHIGIYDGNGKVIHASGAIKNQTISEIEGISYIDSCVGWSYPPQAWYDLFKKRAYKDIGKNVTDIIKQNTIKEENVTVNGELYKIIKLKCKINPVTLNCDSGVHEAIVFTDLNYNPSLNVEVARKIGWIYWAQEIIESEYNYNVIQDDLDNIKKSFEVFDNAYIAWEKTFKSIETNLGTLITEVILSKILKDLNQINKFRTDAGAYYESALNEYASAEVIRIKNNRFINNVDAHDFLSHLLWGEYYKENANNLIDAMMDYYFNVDKIIIDIIYKGGSSIPSISISSIFSIGSKINELGKGMEFELDYISENISTIIPDIPVTLMRLTDEAKYSVELANSFVGVEVLGIEKSFETQQMIQEEKQLVKQVNESLSDRISGKILLQVEKNGEAWYVNPDDQKKYYLGRPDDAFLLMKSLGLGISEDNYESFSNSTVPTRLSGKILLRPEANGEAYYVSPDSLNMYYLGRPADAFQIMREHGLGITNENIRQIDVGELDQF